MPMMRCPRHGTQFAGYSCVHVKEAVDAGRPLVVYVRKVPLTFATLCHDCASALDAGQAVDATAEVNCEACVEEWVHKVGLADYAAWGAEAGDGGPFVPSGGTLPTTSTKS